MSRLTKAISAIFRIVRNPWLLNHVLQQPEIWKNHVIDKYGMKDGLGLVSPEELFGKETEFELNLFTFLDGGSLVTDIVLLKALASRFTNCCYFEIGTWRGESVSNVADVAEMCYTLNLSDEEMREMGVGEDYIKLQGFFSKDIKNVNHLKANSKDFDFSSLNRKFDLIFIDGSHHYDDVRNDTSKVFKHLVHEESIVVWHDYGNTPDHIRYEVLAGILDGLDPESHQFLYHVGHTKSAIYFPHKLNKTKLESPVFPRAFYKVGIKYQKIED
ncbi:MAG: class I SAM-dependent methyltransferase [Bacteroidales bacterium]|nr:class I SAM-dependent methyltransferase [Bacteroidales bacterium]